MSNDGLFDDAFEDEEEVDASEVSIDSDDELVENDELSEALDEVVLDADADADDKPMPDVIVKVGSDSPIDIPVEIDGSDDELIPVSRFVANSVHYTVDNMTKYVHDRAHVVGGYENEDGTYTLVKNRGGVLGRLIKNVNANYMLRIVKVERPVNQYPLGWQFASPTRPILYMQPFGADDPEEVRYSAQFNTETKETEFTFDGMSGLDLSTVEFVTKSITRFAAYVRFAERFLYAEQAEDQEDDEETDA